MRVRGRHVRPPHQRGVRDRSAWQRAGTAALPEVREAGADPDAALPVWMQAPGAMRGRRRGVLAMPTRVTTTPGSERARAARRRRPRRRQRSMRGDCACLRTGLHRRAQSARLHLLPRPGGRGSAPRRRSHRRRSDNHDSGSNDGGAAPARGRRHVHQQYRGVRDRRTSQCPGLPVQLAGAYCCITPR